MTETDALPPPEPAGAGDGPRFIRSLRLTNLLSFGPKGEEIELRSLNVLVGANGSGKTNFVEALAVLASAPHRLRGANPQRRRIGVWVNASASNESIRIQCIVVDQRPVRTFHHSLTVGRDSTHAIVEQEEIIREIVLPKPSKVTQVYAFDEGDVLIANRLSMLVPFEQKISQKGSVLSQLKDRNTYPEIARLQRVYGLVRLYRSWTFGPESSLRKPQASDLPNEWLAEDCGNLFLILNRLKFELEAKGEFLERLRDFLPDVTDYETLVQGNTLQLFLFEGRKQVPATRLSDGTLRWLCLLAILVAPSPPGVIVLEEPELGLHPDMINTLADMLKKAATRHQLVITTHSDILIDALSDVPEAVMVVEKGEQGTTIRRLDAEELKPWLEKYRLGRLWMRGQIGGTRW